MKASGEKPFAHEGGEYSIRPTVIGSLDAFVIDNAVVRLTIVPKLGGKIISLIRLESDHEYLLQPPEPGRVGVLPQDLEHRHAGVARDRGAAQDRPPQCR